MDGTDGSQVQQGRALAAMRHRDFRLIAIGNAVSQMGFWGQYVAVGWSAKQLTDSNLVISVLFGAQWLPMLLLSPFAGVFADRYDRRLIVMWGNVAMVAPPIATGVLVQTEHITLTLLLILVLLSGIGTAFTTPAASAFITALVPATDLHSAISLNQGLTNSTRIIGPALAGGMIAAWGPAWGFHVNAVSFLAVAAACGVVRARPLAALAADARQGVLRELRTGIEYCRTNREVGLMILLVSMVGFFILHSSLLPVIAKDVLDGDASTYGLLATAPGVGTVLAAIVTTNLTSERSRLRVVIGSVCLVPLGVLAIGVSRTLPVALLALGAFGLVWMTFATLLSAMVVTVTDDAYRGRVVGLLSMASIGVFPVNSVIAGVMADIMGAATTIVVSAVALAMAVIVFFARGYMRVIVRGTHQ